MDSNEKPGTVSFSDIYSYLLDHTLVERRINQNELHAIYSKGKAASLHISAKTFC